MKLIVILSLAVLVACDFSASDPETPSNVYAVPEKGELGEGSVSSTKLGKPFLNSENFYQGAFPPPRFPPENFFSPINFPSFNYPIKTFNYAASPQGVLPPISQIIPPQVSQIVPPISQIIPPQVSQIVPPIFGNAKPILPAPSPILPSQTFPPQILSSASKPFFNQFTFPSYPPLHQYSYLFPSTFSFPPTAFFSTQAQKQPAKAQQESLSTSYGPPVSTAIDSEPSSPVESSASFEPSPVSFPYEPAVSEAQEPALPHKPAQEYGPPSSK